MTANTNINIATILTAAHAEFEKGLRARAFFKTNNHAVGNDLVQDTFLKTWRYLIKGGKIKIMKSFLYHILNNLIIDHYRKKKSVSLDNILEKGVDFKNNDGDNKIHNVMDGEQAIRLIDKLPEIYKRVIYMRYVDELSITEIAARTKQSRNTTTVQLHRGLEKLKVLYRH